MVELNNDQNSGPTWYYSRLLRNHFEEIHGYRQQTNREKQQKIIEERAEKVQQLKRLLKEQKQKLKQLNDELPKLKSKKARSLRSEIRSGISKKIAEVNYDKLNPLYISTEPSIEIINSNIKTLENELKIYTD